MAFTFVSSNGNNSLGGGTSMTVGLTGVAAGDLIVVYAKWEGSDSTVSVSDGTSSLTGLANNYQFGDLGGKVLYLLSSVATGSVTYTVTWGTSSSWKRAIAFAFRPTGTCTFQTSAAGSNAGSTAVTSGTYSLSGSGGWVALGFYGEYSGTGVGTFLVNAVAATGSQFADITASSTLAAGWYRLVSATFAGGASTATLSGASAWICNAAAFNDDGGGGGGGGDQPTMRRWGGTPGMTPGGAKIGRGW